jgi:hypothetical protein
VRRGIELWRIAVLALLTLYSVAARSSSKPAVPPGWTTRCRSSGARAIWCRA